MNSNSMKRRAFSSAMVAACMWIWLHGSAAGLAQTRSETGSEQSFVTWESPAKLHHFARKDKGDLRINTDGIEFRPLKAAPIKIPYLEMQTFQLAPHSLSIKTYENRKMRFHEGGLDYVSSASGDSRSWRWADLQTLSAPDPYHLLVFGYRDTYTFDLKKILLQPLYYRLVDALDRHNAADSAQTIGY